jgi:hypothetical protein
VLTPAGACRRGPRDEQDALALVPRERRRPLELHGRLELPAEPRQHVAADAQLLELALEELLASDLVDRPSIVRFVSSAVTSNHQSSPLPRRGKPVSAAPFMLTARRAGATPARDPHKPRSDCGPPVDH